jgi:hypothetical protein
MLYFNQKKITKIKVMKTINLVSTALVADWTKKGSLVCTPLTSEQFVSLVKNAEIKNFCGHPATTEILNNSGLNIPDQIIQLNPDGSPKKNSHGFPQGAFWNGVGLAVAARPKGGVRAAVHDTLVNNLDELEFLQFQFIES